ncbi:MAG TPA: WD40 repeat domain-containing protein [Gemmataceae bacterium]|nr:WD40 repeat domain-containing protein [Gemmataceae bacterium]
MLQSQWKIAALVLLAPVGLFGQSAEILATSVSASAVTDEPAKPQDVALNGQAPSKPVAQEQTGMDLYGDPLPAGAVARLGSVQFRHAGLSTFRALPDGKTVISIGSDRVLRYWDMVTGALVRTTLLQGDAGPGRMNTITPDGKHALALDKNKIVVWEVDTGRQIKTLPGPKSDISYVNFSPDSKQVIVGTWDLKVTAWDWENEIQKPMPFPNRTVGMDSTFHFGFSPDGNLFVGGGGSKSPLCVYEPPAREIYQFNCDASVSRFSPDGKRLAVACMTNDEGKSEAVIRMFDMASGKQEAAFALGHPHSYFSLVFSPDGRTLACGASDRSCILDCSSGKILQQLPGRPWELRFSRDGAILIYSSSQKLHFFDVATGKHLHDRPGEVGYDPALAISPDGRYLASVSWTDPHVSFWDMATGRLLRQLSLKGEKRYVRNLAFSGDGKTLVASQGMGFLQFWNVATGQEIRTVQLDNPEITNRNSPYFYKLCVSPDGEHVRTLERTFRQATVLGTWETKSGSLLYKHDFPGEIRDGVLSLQDNAVALPLKEGLSIIDPRSGGVSFRIPGSSTGGPITASRDGRLLAGIKGADNAKPGAPVTIAIWEAATGKEISSLESSRPLWLAISPETHALLTTDAESLKVWDFATGRERKRWPLPVQKMDSWGKTFVSGLAVSPDGSRAVTALADGTALVWDISP